ncbi:photosystem II D1 precursor processing protein PSB27-H2, chloroplastic-like isoform X1 [Zingiber officinale]|uniref:photosystem II D1 precursor processing protein PSB27-H2, chloroplastic-like isoform X1 n=1 Tax=Zingiber officinale TaxID=94328 RepID=UPI001C4B8633|nr:photosystem II D1 precursor processing protein PSB27-H2, chloroplastic-like isoform X1 [Zingiber officinale]XP_042413001.1 photosystem II D1 precursor processing protein PSB27-H2, chloroplastic-like isoform X1 [Zingiber officinale]XP_042413002.1 photosystem II D1 precursor processing protein PSB27-H2, chloroplastic-like isoform X1 [Zingiber officinale]
MLVTFSSIHVCYICSSEPIGRKHFCIQSSQETLLTRRITAISSGTTLVSGLIYNTLALPIRAEEDNNQNDPKGEGDNGAFGTIKSIFDPDEKTKTGKLLPKAYLKDAREVVKTLRESLEEDVKDASKFRRSADAAKESIRQYLSNWKGQSTVVAEESYAAIEKAIRTLANFYSKEGPFATMTDEVKATILGDLKTAEDFL